MNAFFKRDPRSYSGRGIKPTVLGYIALAYLFIFFGCGCVKFGGIVGDALQWLTGDSLNQHLFEIVALASFFLTIGAIGAIQHAENSDRKSFHWMYFLFGALFLATSIIAHLIISLF